MVSFRSNPSFLNPIGCIPVPNTAINNAMKKASKKFAMTIISLVSLTILPKEIPAIAQQRDLRQFVDSVKSVEQVKREIGRLISAVDNCGVGSCFNFNSTSICELVSALDVQVNGQIVGGMTSGEHLKVAKVVKNQVFH
jgi:hypothetical protein